MPQRLFPHCVVLRASESLQLSPLIPGKPCTPATPASPHSSSVFSVGLCITHSNATPSYLSLLQPPWPLPLGRQHVHSSTLVSWLESRQLLPGVLDTGFLTYGVLSSCTLLDKAFNSLCVPIIPGRPPFLSTMHIPQGSKPIFLKSVLPPCNQMPQRSQVSFPWLTGPLSLVLGEAWCFQTRLLASW